MKTIVSISFGVIAAVTAALIAPLLFAAPGAHGPNGEHLEVTEQYQGTQTPRFEAATEQVEVVGELLDHELRLYVHEFTSNRPIIGADILLEYGELNSNAGYDAEHGHYSVIDTQLLQRLKQAGEHSLLITVLSADIADLIPASLIMTEVMPADEHAHDTHQHLPWGWIIALLIALATGTIIGRKTLVSSEVTA